MKKIQQKVLLFLLVLIWGGLSLLCLFGPEKDFSESERRKLAKAPAFTAENVVSGKYFRDFEKYSLDQFPMREKFRTLKSVSEFYLFGKSDHHDIYLSDGYAAKIEYPLKESSVAHAVKKLDGLYETYIKEKGGQVYLSVVPDKGYFLAEKTGHPAMDYDALFAQAARGLPYAEYIDLTPYLELEAYYRTDSHWKQEKITDAAKALAQAMGVSLSGEYEEITVEKPFFGVYYGQSALPLKNDTIHCLSNEILEKCTVFNEELQETTGLYNWDKLDSRDMYEVYLSGASPLLVIENPGVKEKKELIVFRDSFGSSIVPLLAEAYSKITLVDIRYIPSAQVGEYVTFDEADVLFLYSTTVLNNSQSLR